MMMTKQHLHVAVVAGAMLMALTACDGTKFTEQLTDTFMTVTQKGGPTLGYSPSSGVKILTVDGYAFKDLNRNDSLDAYEDWRISPQERSADLASKLSIEEIAGMMLYSGHQSVPSENITDAQKKFLSEDNLRAVLVTSVASPEVAAKWNNNVQAFVEGLGHGVPSNNSSERRLGRTHLTVADDSRNGRHLRPGSRGGVRPDCFQGVQGARHRDGSVSPDRPGYRTPLVPFQRHFRRGPRP